MASKTVHVEQSGRVLKILIDNPPVNNGTFAMVDELRAVIDKLKNDSSVGTVIFMGNLPGYFINFFSGAELGNVKLPTFSVKQAAFLLNTVGLLTRIPGMSD